MVQRRALNSHVAAVFLRTEFYVVVATQRPQRLDLEQGGSAAQLPVYANSAGLELKVVGDRLRCRAPSVSVTLGMARMGRNARVARMQVGRTTPVQLPEADRGRLRVSKRHGNP